MPFRSHQLIRELDITGGNDAAVGYYAGMIVGVDIMPCVICYSNCRILFTGVSLLRNAGTDSVEVGSAV